MAAGERLPLAGVPYAAKDNIDVLGLETTAACPAFDYSPARSATVIERLEGAGAITMGGLNMAEFAQNPTGHNRHFGDCLNPWNGDYITGGSSSGSGAAVRCAPRAPAPPASVAPSAAAVASLTIPTRDDMCTPQDRGVPTAGT